MSTVIEFPGNISALPSPSEDICLTTPLSKEHEDISSTSPSSISSALISPLERASRLGDI